MAPPDAEDGDAVAKYHLTHEFGRRAEELLRGMEHNFLSILAEGQSPKAEALPEGGSDGGLVSAVSGEPTALVVVDGVEKVQVIIRAQRDVLDRYVEAYIHVLDHGCESGLSDLATIGGSVAHSLIDAAVAIGWYTEPFPPIGGHEDEEL